MIEDNKKENITEQLLEEQEAFIQNELIKERKLAIKIGIVFFLFALIGPYLPPKIPSFKETNINYFPQVLFHFLCWGIFYLIMLRKYFNLKKDYEAKIKVNSSTRVLKKEISKGSVSIKYTIKIEVEKKGSENFKVSQDLFEKVEENENIFISYTPHSKTILELQKM